MLLRFFKVISCIFACLFVTFFVYGIVCFNEYNFLVFIGVYPFLSVMFIKNVDKMKSFYSTLLFSTILTAIGIVLLKYNW